MIKGSNRLPATKDSRLAIGTPTTFVKLICDVMKGFVRMLHVARCVGVCCLFATVSVLGASKIVRGPYLQLGTPESMVVRWRTDTAVASEIRYGMSANQLNLEWKGRGKTTEHIGLLTGLQPATVYYYSISGAGGGFSSGGEKPFAFRTSPRLGSRGKVRAWVIGDSGTANTNAAIVRDAYDRFNSAGRTDVWLMLGDNAYPDGTDAEYQKAVFQMYTNALPYWVLWPTLGNHDARSASSATQSGVYFDIFTLPTLGQAGGVSTGTEAYYSFDYGNVHFICLDSEDSQRSRSGAMLTWLKHDLASTKQEWLVAYFHHPPYTKGSHDSDNIRDSGGRMRDMREVVLPMLEKAGVDLVLTGHSHSYERSYLVDGHYGKSKTLEPKMILDRGDGRPDGDGAYKKKSPNARGNDGAVYAVAGSSGQVSGGKLNHPIKFLSLNVLGSMVLDFDGGRMEARFLDDRGETRDWFTMFKPTPR